MEIEVSTGDSYDSAITGLPITGGNQRIYTSNGDWKEVVSEVYTLTGSLPLSNIADASEHRIYGLDLQPVFASFDFVLVCEPSAVFPTVADHKE